MRISARVFSEIRHPHPPAHTRWAEQVSARIPADIHAKNDPLAAKGKSSSP
ncbi:hypothetical protein PGTUg99_036426 [Puccinia graminis f. sp. tritici]|uniref:Uncharacterized protein n=1 Tax=Puccinia graminis f. sp. tritici TaxID=56615 RepID=A0A5B0S2B9_PUCGR|nr:hypothetical protein PGTUg99_036426 [Puccinia graminis f. sp. tritici]